MSNLISLWKRLEPHRRRQFGLLLVLMIVASFSEIVSIGAILPFLAALTNPERLYKQAWLLPVIRRLHLTTPHELLLPLTLAFCVAALLSGALRLMMLWGQTRLSHAIGADLSISIYRRTLYQPYPVHLARNSGEVIAGVSQKANEVIYLTILPTQIIISSVVMLVSIMSILLLVEPYLALAAFAGFASIYLVIVAFTRKTLKRNSQRVAQEQGLVIKALQEGLGGIRDVLIDGTQETYCQVYRSADLPLRHARAKIQVISGSPRFGIEGLGMVLIAGLAYALSAREGGLGNAVPILGTLGLGSQRLLPVLQQAYANWALVRGGQSSLRDVLELLDQPIPEYATQPPPAPIPFEHEIGIDKLSFRYSPEGPWVLEEIDLAIPKGARIGIIGHTGCGKTTLLDIIMGLLQPTEGSLRVDGKKITPANHRSWQVHIAHVPQAIFLADTSVAENIALGTPVDKIDLNRVRDAARKAQIAETIEAMDQQYDTYVGERGVRLSGGQRQRIGIARALYKEADVIVFDEATSALDMETERTVMAAIDNISADITVLIVAHRLTTLKQCYRIVELGNGSILRTGTYEEMTHAQDLTHI